MKDNNWIAPEDRMPEGEVALRLAEYLSEHPRFGGRVDVAIDGASVQVGERQIFDIDRYLRSQGWLAIDGSVSSKNSWAGNYRRGTSILSIHSHSGVGDVEATIGGRRLVAECKKGPLTSKRGSQERPLLTTAIGQALLFPSRTDDIVVAAVPDTSSFSRLADIFRQMPLFIQSGIQIALVNRNGRVSGLNIP